MSDKDASLLKVINHKIDILLESYALVAPVSKKLDDINERLIRVEADVKVIKQLVTARNP